MFAEIFLPLNKIFAYRSYMTLKTSEGKSIIQIKRVFSQVKYLRYANIICSSPKNFVILRFICNMIS